MNPWQIIVRLSDIINYCLIGNHTLAGQDIAYRFSHPRPGDLVYENSSRDEKGIGRLILTRKERVHETSDVDYMDDFTYIETLDGELIRWNNCEFNRILNFNIFQLRREGDPEDKDWVIEAIERHRL